MTKLAEAFFVMVGGGSLAAAKFRSHGTEAEQLAGLLRAEQVGVPAPPTQRTGSVIRRPSK